MDSFCKPALARGTGRAENTPDAPPGWRATRSYTAEMDVLVSGLYEEHLRIPPSSETALVALGGYGRRELCPHSDIDLLFLVGDTTSMDQVVSTVSQVIYPLWDRKLDVSQSVRTVTQTIEDAGEDFPLLTSLLDARRLAGSPALFARLISDFEKTILVGHCSRFIENLLAQDRERRHALGNDAYSLEPNLKEGQGGLRDYHSIFWAAKGILGLMDLTEIELEGLLTERDRRELEHAVDFLLQARIELHRVSGRKNDRLLFDYQEIVARNLGFQATTPEATIESFMKHLHRTILIVKAQNEAFLERIRDHLSIFKDDTRFVIDSRFHVVSGRVDFQSVHVVKEHPELILKLFEHMARLDRAVHPSARQLIRRRLEWVDLCRESEHAKSSFRRLLTEKGGRRALETMLETGVLDRFIPEFEHIRGQTQFDLYHTCTVDRHSILTVFELKELEDTHPEVFARLRNRELLYATALFHDIGKGYGSSHAKRGAAIALENLIGLGFTREEAELGAFVIENHLRLAEIATKRDLSEERVAFRFARDMGAVEALCMLYLLTIADSKATGPAAWSSWKDSLTRELFLKTLKFLEQGDLKERQTVMDIEDRWNALLREAPGLLGEERAGLLESLPQAYVLSFDLPVILEHFEMSKNIETPADVEIKVRAQGRLHEVTIAALDRPGLFSRLTGVFSLNHFDIRAGKVFTWWNKLAVDVFEVVPPWTDYTEWDRLASQFRKAVAGRLALSARMHHVRPPLDHVPKITLKQKPRITIDNASSDFYTVIEVVSPDRVGLLYEIARTLSEFDLNILRAFISNKGDLAADAFYVCDLLGRKIEDPEHLKEIIRAVEHALS